MMYTFSDKIAALQPSAIREILKATSQPGIIPFAAGNPSAEAFPVEAIQSITNDILQEQPIAALQYGITEGYPLLIQAVKDMVTEREHCYNPETDDVLITSGAQQAIELFAKCIVNEGDIILTEDPSFIGSLNSFRSFNAKLYGIPVEDDGLSLEALENALQTQKNVKFLYTIPNFQNPTGVTMSLEKRKGILELAEKYDILVLEDNPYGELRIEGEPLPTIKSMDKNGRVVYVGSFSKILSPGLRIGFSVAPKAISAKMTVAKQGEDVHTPMLNQMIAHRFLTQYDLQAHIEKIRGIYRAKAHLMLDEMDKHLPKEIKYIRPQGGLFIWCALPEDVDMLGYVRRAVDQKVAVVPGSAFLPDQSKTSHAIRLNFSTPSSEAIVEGIRILGTIPLR